MGNFQRGTLALLFSVAVTGCGIHDKSVTASQPGGGTENHPTGISQFPDGENGIDFTLHGAQWSKTNLSVSFMPDGTKVYTDTSDLFAHLSPVGSQEAWQREIIRALARWSAVTPLNFHVVADNGSADPAVLPGPNVASPPFGDLRVGARPLSIGYVAITYFPLASSTISGHVFLSTNWTFNINGTYGDLFATTIHELGHALGLKDTPCPINPSTGACAYYPVMYPYLQNFTALTPDDISGIQAIYGPRTADSYDLAGSNNTPDTASDVTAAATGQTFVNGDITTLGDLDHYGFVVPAGAAPVVSITAEGGISLLQPRIRIFDATGVMLREVSAVGYGKGALLQLPVTSGTKYIVGVDSPATDEFGIGAYRLAIEFRATEDGVAYAPIALAIDSRETNNAQPMAANLGQVSKTLTVNGLNVHSEFDEDYFKFTAPGSRSASSFQIWLTYPSGTNPSQFQFGIFNNYQQKISVANGTSIISLSVPGTGVATDYWVRVYCPSRAVGSYNLNIKKN